MKKIDCFSNAIIAYRVLLVVVGFAEIRFFKIMLLKFYLESTMPYERLNELTIIVIENDILES